MAPWRTSTQTLVLLCFLVLTKVNFLEAAESNTRSQNVACIEKERNALLEFRKGLKDPSSWLSSWAGKDCCNWTGVNCSNMTGNIVMLHLKTMDYCGLVGHSEALNIGTCLSDLSGNNFQGISILEFIGSLKTLRYLDLSRASFIGGVPHSLGNLSYLEYLALSKGAPEAGSFMNLSKANNWVEAVNMFPSLTTLDLSCCELQDFAESLRINFTSLSVLDLSYNNFNTTIPCWLFNITTLQRVYLQRSEFKGSLPEVSRGSLCNLRTLDLSSNAINGKIKGFINALGGCGNNTLDYLDLSSNNLQGKLPNSFANLKYLSFLRLAQNSFSGSLPWSIGNLCNLVMLDLTPVDAFEIILSGVEISDIILVWFWNLTSELQWVDILNNQLKGKLPGPISFEFDNITGAWLDLGFNRLEGLRMSKVKDLDLSRNFFNGSIPASINEMETLSFLDLSITISLVSFLQSCRAALDLVSAHLFNLIYLGLRANFLRGNIPEQLCEFPYLHIIDIAQNKLSGTIPKCLENLKTFTYLGPYFDELPSTLHIEFREHVEIVPKGRQSECTKIILLLNVIDLSANNLKGEIPNHITKLSALFTLNLSWNHLSGKISENIGNLQRLESLDLYTTTFQAQFLLA
ncbi:hypothetical protein CXB51_005188 [Gossypium anomalum]|uniref:Leucine-rich repeat-containing N-terminal plant-type domain-containing protein n=1 Tax=Gossypium anomalum TaxID=47600 RepID=A0A8J5ZW13_9ROSI|nr:hypothetical protein CXB51_005188 [Gossypium anomalum]